MVVFIPGWMGSRPSQPLSVRRNRIASIEVKDLQSAPAGNSQEISRRRDRHHTISDGSCRHILRCAGCREVSGTVCCVDGELGRATLFEEEPDSQVVRWVHGGRERTVVPVRVAGNRRIYREPAERPVAEVSLGGEPRCITIVTPSVVRVLIVAEEVQSRRCVPEYIAKPIAIGIVRATEIGEDAVRSFMEGENRVPRCRRLLRRRGVQC